MIVFENEKYLAEVHEVVDDSSSNGTRFIGNCLIAKFPDGRRALLTAKHVAFDITEPRRITIKTHPDFIEPLPKEIRFRRRVKENGKVEWGDVVEMPLPNGDGIPVTKTLSSENLIVRASLHGSRIDVPVRMINIGATREHDSIALNSPILHTVGRDPNNTIYPGFSGSGMFDENDAVIALTSYGKIGVQPSQVSGFIIMTPRAGILEE